MKAKRAGELTSSLARHFLQLTIRPLFLKARPSSVTDAGRRVTTTVLPAKMTADSLNDEVNKPWKDDKQAFALDLLVWVVQALDEKLLEEVWHMVVPPVLTLADDWETKYKRLGAELLRKVLEVTPPLLLARTGLGEVFEEALLPCLTFLPTITPENESLALLSAVYPALLALSRTRYPKTPQPSNSKFSTADLSRQRTKFLDTIIRKGILYGYQHCSQYPRITRLLFDYLALLINELGIDSVKHLQYILPMLTDTLSHPLAAGQTATLTSAVQMLQSVILNAWPRMPEHRGQVLKGLTLCWLNQVDGTGEEVESLRAEMQTAIKMLGSALGSNVDFEKECAVLIVADKRLEGLLLRPSP